MSSPNYVVRLRPERRLRRATLLTGSLLTLVGAMLLLHLPLAAPWRAVAVPVWFALGAVELCGQARTAARVRELTLRAPAVLCAHLADGRAEPARLLPGSVLTSRLGWLRIGFADGRRYGELISPATSGREGWRRLAVLWRLGA